MTSILFALVIGHAIADYPLQGDFLARGKNHLAPLPGVPWFVCLLSHALIHAAPVWIVTGVPGLGLFEVGVHVLIDFGKSAGWFGAGGRAFWIDQGLHVGCKAFYVAWLAVFAW